MNHPPLKCPHCQNDDEDLIEVVQTRKHYLMCVCEVCAKMFEVRLDG